MKRRENSVFLCCLRGSRALPAAGGSPSPPAGVELMSLPLPARADDRHGTLQTQALNACLFMDGCTLLEPYLPFPVPKTPSGQKTGEELPGRGSFHIPVSSGSWKSGTSGGKSSCASPTQGRGKGDLNPCPWRISNMGIKSLHWGQNSEKREILGIPCGNMSWELSKLFLEDL